MLIDFMKQGVSKKYGKTLLASKFKVELFSIIQFKELFQSIKNLEKL